MIKVPLSLHERGTERNINDRFLSSKTIADRYEKNLAPPFWQQARADIKMTGNREKYSLPLLYGKKLI
jgi:hypothetical protein